MSLTAAPLSALAPCPTIDKNHRKEKIALMKLTKQPKQARAGKINYSATELPSMRFAPPCTRPFFVRAGKMKTAGKKAKNTEVMQAAMQAEIVAPEVGHGTPVEALPNANCCPTEMLQGPKAATESHCYDQPAQYEPTDNKSTDTVQQEKHGDQSELLVVSLDEAPGPHPALLRGDSSSATVVVEPKTMEVPLTIRNSVRKRPKIQLTIPEQRPLSFAYVPHPSTSDVTKGVIEDHAVSPPSPTRHRMSTCDSTMRLSIVSPVSVMEMPKPRRPFSTWSLAPTLQDIGLEQTIITSLEPKSSSSGSSDETADDDEVSSCYSLRSSMSSFGADTATKPLGDQRGSAAFSIISPSRAGIFDDIPPTPKLPLLKKSMLSLAESISKPRSLAESVNKPLPPEPSVMGIAPLLPSGRPCSRLTSKASKLGLFIPKSSPCPINIPSRNSSRMSLHSKYTTTDVRALDALDDAFQRSSPRKMSFENTQQETPTLSQAEEALEAQLFTINEDAPFHWDEIPLVHDPLQISRGPMHMEPSRAPPPPPLVSEALSMSRRRDRRKSTLHVAQQMKAAETDNSCRRGSLPIGLHGTWKAKVHNVLAKADARISTPIRRKASSDSGWSFGGSQRSLASLSDASAEDTPGSEVSSSPDPAVVEIKGRLELLKITAESVPARDRSRAPSIASSVNLPIQQCSADSIRSSSVDQGNVAPPTRRGRQTDRQVHSMGSLAISDIPELYANMPAFDPEARRSMTAEEIERQLSAEAAEKVLLRILQSLDNLQDLFAAAVVSKGFYHTFKRNELPLMRNAVYAMSPAAWELREMSPPYTTGKDVDGDAPVPEYTPATYLHHYTRDMYTMVALKSLILVHCETFLRAETISALAGTESARSSEIDEAFWRVWTFCRIFGCGKNREDDIVGQMDWLKGGELASCQSTTSSMSITDPFGMNSVLFTPPPSFAKGNQKGLTIEELYDMTEIWTCLGVLVRGFQGKAEQAREHGIFEKADIFPGDVDKENAILEEWTYHLLTLGPSTILDLAGASSPTARTFAQAQSSGWTSWQPPGFGASKSTFLKEAVSRVYEEKLTKRMSSQMEAGRQSHAGDVLQSRQRCASHAAEIRARKHSSDYAELPISDERPLSKYPEVVRKLETMPKPPCSPAPKGQQVKDPVDMALERLVAMGFDEANAKRALAETDSGNAIDFDAAVNKLVRERKSKVRYGALRYGW
ncbi:MAG: hypothetical protein M1830_009462 [Pleopsidium flavum]|nr:MAG: hypothetical protein M1830_009462 [Pleopsidium flavum]